MNKKTLKCFTAIICMILCFMVNGIENVYAYSDTEKANLPKTNYYVQANVWQSNTYFFQSHSFKVSAKLYNGSACKTTTKADRIKTSYSFSPSGVGVSISGISAGTSNGKGFSGTWENRNAWISDMSGTFKIKGVPLYSTFSNSAFALKSGVKATAVASCFRFY